MMQKSASNPVLRVLLLVCAKLLDRPEGPDPGPEVCSAESSIPVGFVLGQHPWGVCMRNACCPTTRTLLSVIPWDGGGGERGWPVGWQTH